MNTETVENVKIVKRHNAGSIIIGILCLLSVAIPVVYWFFPWFQVRFFDVTNTSETMAYKSGTSIVYFLSIFKCLIGQPDDQIHLLVHNGWVNYQVHGNIMKYFVIRENLYAAGGWYLISIFFCFIMFITGIVILIRGRVKSVRALTVTVFFFMFANGMLLLDCWRLGAYYQFAFKKACAISGATISTKYTIFWPLLFAVSAFLIWLIIEIIYLAAFRKRYYLEDIEVVDINGPMSKTLPDNITSIGGHAFSKNTYLETANIKEGITELGVGAFANCLNLSSVSIPKSVIKIESNCFFNTPKLDCINYAGTKEEWSHIVRGSNWLSKSKTNTINCIDGPISVDPFR